MEYKADNDHVLLMVMRTVAISLLEVSWTFAMAQGVQPEAPKIVTVCDILSKPLQFNGRMVTIRSRVEGTDEGGWLTGNDCPGALVTDQHTWPSEIALVAWAGLHHPPVDFGFDADSERRANARYKELRTRAPDRCIVWTYTGLFETRTNWSESIAVYADGTSKLIGFGHGGEAPGQLIIKSVDDVSIIPNCSAGRSPKNR